MNLSYNKNLQVRIHTHSFISALTHASLPSLPSVVQILHTTLSALRDSYSLFLHSLMPHCPHCALWFKSFTLLSLHSGIHILYFCTHSCLTALTALCGSNPFTLLALHPVIQSLSHDSHCALRFKSFHSGLG